MEIILGIVAVVAVIGQIIFGVFLLILNKKEREGLYKLIKSKDFVEYTSLTGEPDKDEAEEVVDLDVDQIPFLGEKEE